MELPTFPFISAYIFKIVRNISTWITAALWNEQFFSLVELNSAIREKLEQFNANTFQKKEGSRRSLFLGEEMPLLATLSLSNQMPVLPALTIVQDESSIRNSSNVSPPANTLQSIGTSLLPVQPEVARHTWPVLLAWKPASSITQ